MNTGNGSDAVVSPFVRCRGAAVNTGAGGDGVALWDVEAVSTVAINTSNGVDQIIVVELHAWGNVTVDSGNAEAILGDQVLITDSEDKKLVPNRHGDICRHRHSDEIDAVLIDLLAEHGWDELGIVTDEVAVWGKLTVATGGGWDSLSIGRCWIAGSVLGNMVPATIECEMLDCFVGATATVKMGAGDDGLAARGQRSSRQSDAGRRRRSVRYAGRPGREPLCALVVKGFEPFLNPSHHQHDSRRPRSRYFPAPERGCFRTTQAVSSSQDDRSSPAC